MTIAVYWDVKEQQKQTNKTCEVLIAPCGAVIDVTVLLIASELKAVLILSLKIVQGKPLLYNTFCGIFIISG